MKNVKIVVAVATLYLIIFNILLYAGVAKELVFLMLTFSPFVIIYMVYVILKYGKASGYTFKERFYDDWDQRI